MKHLIERLLVVLLCCSASAFSGQVASIDDAQESYTGRDSEDNESGDLKSGHQMIAAGIKKNSQTQQLSRSESGGVQATVEPIVIPRFSNVDIKIDGRLDEPVWREVQGYDNMTVIQPDTMAVPRFRSISKFFYTDDGLYVSMHNEQPPDTLIKRLSSRDDSINRDGMSLTLDTSGEGLYGVWFSVNLGGSVVDGKVLPEYEFSNQWDGPWLGDSVATEDGYATEMFLPWSMMAMPDTEGKRRMGFYISRKVAYLDERWGWPALPMTASKFMSALQPIEMENVNPRRQFALFPFSSSSYDNIKSESEFRVGIDAFWRPSSNLQLTTTINPDFGTVESDNVVVNLTSFETFFPEKRLFFLEGSEIFVTSPRGRVFSGGGGGGARRTASSFTPEPTTLLNTRRIGGPALDPDTPAGVSIAGVELGKPTELFGAVKLTGQRGGFRYGVLAAFEEDSEFETVLSGSALTADADEIISEVEQTGRDFGAVRFLYEQAGEGRRSIGWLTTAVLHDSFDAYVHGLDGHYLSGDGTWKWDGQLIYSDVDDVDGYGGFVDLSYIPRRGLFHRISFDYLDEKLDVDDFGFIRRNDSINLNYSFNYQTSALKKFRNLSNSILLSQQYNIDGRVVRSGLFYRTGITFLNKNQLNSLIAYFPERWDDRNSDGNGEYRIHDRWVTELNYGTDSSRKVSVSFGGGFTQEELSGSTYSGNVGVTFKPTDRFSIDLDVNYKRRHGWLLHWAGRDFTTYDARDWQPRLALGFFLSAKQQLQLTMQWAGIKAVGQEFYQVPLGDGKLMQIVKGPNDASRDLTISRLTAQIRYRWEIAPLSDLFIVYTRGSNLPDRGPDEFDDLFHDALTQPVIDIFVIKLRYRFGT